MPATTTPTTERIGFLLIPQFTLLAFASAVEPLRLANRATGRALYEWRLLSKDGLPVRASFGGEVAVDAAIGDAAGAGGPGHLDTVVLCSGLDGHWYEDARTFAWLRKVAKEGAELGSICTGSHVLARAGLLEGYRCTIHWENLAGFVESFPNVDAGGGELFTTDRNRFTCAGGTAAADMMLHRIAGRHGQALAKQVAEQILQERIRPGTALQPTARAPDEPPAPLLLARARELMRSHVEEPLEVEAIAARLGLSRRSLERLFARHGEGSPARAYLEVRLKRARQLLQQTRMPVVEVALACGFTSAAHFSRAYRAAFGKPPQVDKAARLTATGSAARERRGAAGGPA